MDEDRYGKKSNLSIMYLIQKDLVGLVSTFPG